MRSLLAVAAFLLSTLAVVRAQDDAVITPLLPDPDAITPLVPTGNPDVITPLVTPSAGAGSATTTATLCSSARAIVTPNAMGVEIDPYNPPAGWDCYLVYEQGGGSWTIPIGVNGSSHHTDNRIVKVVVPIVVSVGLALGLLGVGVYAIRRRAQRAHKTAATRPWFKRQGWVNGSTTSVAEISKPQPAMVQTNIV